MSSFCLWVERRTRHRRRRWRLLLFTTDDNTTEATRNARRDDKLVTIVAARWRRERFVRPADHTGSLRRRPARARRCLSLPRTTIIFHRPDTAVDCLLLSSAHAPNSNQLSAICPTRFSATRNPPPVLTSLLCSRFSATKTRPNIFGQMLITYTSTPCFTFFFWSYFTLLAISPKSQKRHFLDRCSFGARQSRYLAVHVTEETV